MAEEKNIAVETNEGAVTPPDNNTATGTVTENNGFTGTEVVDGKEETPKPDDAEKKRNAENARRRREAEQAKKIRAAELNAIKRIVPENPYTHQPIENEDDVEEYLIMRDIESKNGDPVVDYFKYARDIRAQKQNEAHSAEMIHQDIVDFSEKYPDVNVPDILENEDFNEFAEGKWGKSTLTDIYERYRNYIGKVSKAAEDNAKRVATQIAANAASAVGSLNNSGPAEENDFFTREQVKAMSSAEVSANYEKIRKSMKKW
ncbi:MAG: hypothetical protein IJW19_05060 [Clostridia bacterium]|nr:hypothetical protein [Clostridia bacterium]